jgi:hypothetical protein
MMVQFKNIQRREAAIIAKYGSVNSWLDDIDIDWMDDDDLPLEFQDDESFTAPPASVDVISEGLAYPVLEVSPHSAVRDEVVPVPGVDVPTHSEIDAHVALLKALGF